jgi:YbbR domain-containing protein
VRALLRLVVLDWKLKLLALALAVLLWVVVSAEQVTSNWIPVPLEVRVADPMYDLRDASVPQEVEVRFTGPGRELLDLGIRRPPLRLLIPEVEDTVQVFSLAPGMVQMPNELSVNPQEVRPGVVRLRFRRLASKSIPVRPRLGRALGEDYTLVDSLVVEPERIRISGPAARVAEVESIPTRPINLTAADSALRRMVLLDTARLQGLQLSTREVRISGRVDQIVEHTIGGVPISLGPGVSVRPAIVDVWLRGAESVVRPLTPEDFRVVVSIDSIPDQIPEGGVPVPLRVEGLRPGVQARLSPRAVRLLPSSMMLDSVPVPRVIGRPRPSDPGTPELR